MFTIDDAWKHLDAGIVSDVEITDENYLVVTFGVYKPTPKHADPIRRDLVESGFMQGKMARADTGASVWKSVLSLQVFNECHRVVFWWMPWIWEVDFR